MVRCQSGLRAWLQQCSEKRASDEALVNATNETSSTFYKTDEEATVQQARWSRPLFLNPYFRSEKFTSCGPGFVIMNLRLKYATHRGWRCSKFECAELYTEGSKI